MTQRPVMDAGPGLNFLSVDCERVLLGVLGKITVPETVQNEILRKSGRDQRFARAAQVWAKITPKYVDVLADDWTEEIERTITRITQSPYAKRIQRSEDLGETMVIVHAVNAAEAGHDVIVLIDEERGTHLARMEAQRLRRLRDRDARVGSIRTLSTIAVLEAAPRKGLITGRGEMRKIYGRMRERDDGLIPIESTGLLSKRVWNR